MFFFFHGDAGRRGLERSRGFGDGFRRQVWGEGRALRKEGRKFQKQARVKTRMLEMLELFGNCGGGVKKMISKGAG